MDCRYDDCKYFDLEKKVDKLLDMSAEQKESIGKVKSFLFGNGSVGIDERVRVLETANKIMSRILWIISGTVLADIVRRLI